MSVIRRTNNVNDSKTIPVSYFEEGAHMEPIMLSDEAYSSALNSLVVVCADVAIINRRTQTIYLAKRRAKPADTWWFIGGRMYAGERERTAMRRCFLRETGLDLGEDRFEFICMHRYLWKDREQDPTNAGTDNLCYMFVIELTDDEHLQVSQGLEPNEYEVKDGLRAFKRNDLLVEGVLQPSIDLFELLFGAR